MQTTHFRYSLKKYKTPSDRVDCPVCGGKKSFAPYVDIENGVALPEKYGRCNRADQCGYHLNPYTDGYGITEKGKDNFIPAPLRQPKPVKPAVNLPRKLLIESLTNNPDNRFVQHLGKIFPSEVVEHLRKEYMIGDHSVWEGSTVFWFVNIRKEVRAGQVKQFDETGHTAKNQDGSSRTVWIHKLIDKNTEWLPAYEDQDMRVDCLFGEHLLNKYPDRKVALFESPKTAIIATPFFKDFLCLAIGALDYLTAERLQALKGKTVILYPDLSKEGKAFAKWSEKADKLKHLADFKVSSLLEKIATDDQRIKGLDMADFLEGMEYNPEPSPEPQKPHLTNLSDEPIKQEKAETFDLAEHWEWLETLPDKHQPVSLLTCEHKVFNARNFATGRLNHINAFTGYREQGNRPLFILQVQELRKVFNNQ